MAYDLIEPFGEERADLRQAMTSCIMANAWRGKSQNAYKVEDFMLAKEKKPQSDEEMMNVLKQIAR